MQELLSHWLAAIEWLSEYGLLAPMMQLLLATVFGFVFAERWQRWRQRRDFQYRTLAKFSELSYEMMDRLAELLVGRGRILPDLYTERRREMVSRWTVFMSIRGEVMACWGRQLLLTEEYQGLVNALNTLRGYLRTPEPVPLARFEPEQEKFLAYREAIVVDMVHAMGLLSRRHRRAEKRRAQARVEKANAAAADQANAQAQRRPAMTFTELVSRVDRRLDRVVHPISRFPRLAFLVLLVVYVGGIAGLRCIPGFSTGDAVYFMTGVVLIFYAVDTHAMRKLMKEQIDLAQSTSGKKDS